MKQATTLIADIGGTNSRVALAAGDRLVPGSIRRFDNDQFASVARMLSTFLKESNARPSVICLAAAGPVKGDTIQLTNRDWNISKLEIARVTGCAKIALLNDLQAMGYSLAVPEIAGSPLTQTRLTLAIGTGMNAAVALPINGLVHVPPGESGYFSLPFTTQADAPHLSRIAATFGTPVVEAVLSGAGLTRVHHALTGETRVPHEITAGVAGTEATLALALRVLGAYLGSLALAHLPYGGIYLAGSVGRALFPHLDQADFRDHFLMRGAYSDLIESFPLRQITDDTAPLFGAAHYLAQQDFH